MPDRHQTPVQSKPLLYFGNWCGEGWSAAREGQKSLIPDDLRKGAITLLNRHGKKRESPVDMACKTHDIAYDALARERDGYKAARMKLDADRVLLSTVSRLLETNAAGKSDLNMGEVLYAKNVQVAFTTMLLFNGVAVARNLDVALRPHVQRSMQQILPYALVIMAGPSVMGPQILRLSMSPKR